jgi:transcription elongation GreA/GreB family factor
VDRRTDGQAGNRVKTLIFVLNSIKKQLYQYCQQYLLKRIRTAEEAMAAAQASANDETKSSAGDKYETGRAMMQLEIENNSAQLSETLKLKKVLDQLPYDRQASVNVQPGSLVGTDQGNFFIAISVGRVVIENETYAVIAPESPIGLKMMGLTKNDSFSFAGRAYSIIEVR